MTSPASPRPSGRIWPVLVVSLLAMNASIVAVTVYVASTDRSVAVEPDYYAKAITFDETMRRREESARLGWTATPGLRPAADGRSMRLGVTLRDRDGAGVTGAEVSVVAFASARAADRQSLALAGREGEPGVYESDIRIDRPGQWILRITATRADLTFVLDTDLLVPG